MRRGWVGLLLHRTVREVGIVKRLIGIVGLLVTLCMVTGCDDPKQDACRQSGGFTRDSTMTGVGLTTGGKIAVSSFTIRYCIHDGKVTDLWDA